MATALLTGGGTNTVATSNTSYFPIGISVANGAGASTEIQAQQTIETSGTYSNLSIYITANTVTATSTLKFRVNGANGNQSVSIGSSATGWFTDASDTDICLVSQPFLLLTNYSSGAISKITLGGTVSTYATGISGARGIAVDSSGNLFVSTDTNDTILKITPGGIETTFASGLNVADGLNFDSSGNLYEADYNSGNVYKFTSAGVKSTFISGLTNPKDIIFDASGNAYVSAGNSIYKYNSSGGGQTTFASGLSNPQQMVFDSNGNLYVANYGSGIVSKITTGGVVSTFASGLSGPVGLAIANGILYCCNYSSTTVSQITPAGVVSTFASGFSFPCFITYGSLPAVIDVQLITGGSGTSLTFRNIEAIFTALTDTANTTTYFNGSGQAFSSATSTYVSWSSGGTNTTEAPTQYKMQIAATANNLSVYASANTRTSSTTIQSRHNGANGNLSVSIGGSATGLIQDVSDSDVLVPGDYTNSIVSGAASGTLTLTLITCDFVNFNNYSSIFGSGGKTVNTSSTLYFFFGAQPGDGNTTESNVQSKALSGFTTSNLQINIGTNTISASSTVNFRKNGSNGNQSVSIGSLSTGWFTDVSDTDTLVSTDIFNMALTTGGTGTSLSVSGYGLTLRGTGSSELLPLLGVG